MLYTQVMYGFDVLVLVVIIICSECLEIWYEIKTADQAFPDKKKS